MLPSASLREQIQTDRMFESPVRYWNSMSATPRFTPKAITATKPMVIGSGTPPCRKDQIALPRTKMPKPAMQGGLDE